MTRRFRFFIGAVLLLLITTGCRRDVAWIESRKVDAAGWTPDRIVTFELDPEIYREVSNDPFREKTRKAMGDTARRILGTYEAYVSLRYEPDCNAGEAILVVESESLGTLPLLSDTISVTLDRGTNGNPMSAKVRSSKSPLPHPFKVEEGTRVSIYPLPTKDTLQGVTDVTLILMNR